MHQSRKKLIIFYIAVTGKSLIILGTKKKKKEITLVIQ